MKAKTVLDQWIAAINAGDVETAIALYNSEAKLIPTFSGYMLQDPAAIRGYFERLGKNPALSVSLHEDSVRIQACSDTVSVLSGLYTFRFEVDGRLMAFESRFTFVVDCGADAPILHHHSSQIPRSFG